MTPYNELSIQWQRERIEAAAIAERLKPGTAKKKKALDVAENELNIAFARCSLATSDLRDICTHPSVHQGYEETYISGGFDYNGKTYWECKCLYCGIITDKGTTYHDY